MENNEKTNEEVIVVNNEGGKGNPNHEPAGSPKGGQFTSGPKSGGSVNLASKFQAFMKAKNTVTPSSYTFNDVVLKNMVPNCGLNAKNLEKSFLSGTLKAQQVVCDFFRDAKARIDKGDACYKPLFHKIFLENSDLLGTGKKGGFYEIGEVFYHEVMHAIDHLYGNLTTERVLSNGKTLQKTFHDEINDKKYGWSNKLYNEIKADFENSIEEEKNKMFTPEQIKEYNEKAEYYKNALYNLNLEFQKHNKIYDFPSIEAYKAAWNKYNSDFNSLKKEWKKYNEAFLPARQKATHKYSTLSDFCSYIYHTGLKGSICGGHTKSYWSQDFGNKAVKEMWAELGSMWSRGKSEDIERMRKYFPDTVSSFEELVGNLDNIRKEKYGV